MTAPSHLATVRSGFGRSTAPVREYLDSLSDEERLELAAMSTVELGLIKGRWILVIFRAW
jgi:hypothetical protein